MDLRDRNPVSLLFVAGISTLLTGVPARAADQTASWHQTLSYSILGKTPKMSRVATRRNRYRDGAYRGRTFNAYYGVVQVAARIRNGKLVYVDVLKHPTDYRTSRIINRRALPVLEREVIAAQSARR